MAERDADVVVIGGGGAGLAAAVAAAEAGAAVLVLEQQPAPGGKRWLIQPLQKHRQRHSFGPAQLTGIHAVIIKSLQPGSQQPLFKLRNYLITYCQIRPQKNINRPHPALSDFV